MMLRTRLPLVGLLVTATAIGISGCSSSTKTATPAAPSTPATASSASAPATASSSATTATLFGSGCASLSLTDAAVAPAAAVPVGTAAALIPFLSSVVSASTAGGLTSTLDAAPAITVFAPDNAAFAKEPAGQVQALLTQPSEKPTLIATLKYAVIPSRLTEAQLAGKHTTLQGSTLTIAGTAPNFTINGTSKIICGPIQTKNASVYIIDTVLHPAS
jgi:uncharacterized surface protein with fasciclin (FAS1) repeats